MGHSEETNQNCFHIFGIDILIDEKHKPWLLEINWFPSFSIFQETTEIDPIDKVESKVRRISEFDKYLKSLILKEAIEIVKYKELPQGSVFEQIFPPQQSAHEYADFSIFNESRIVFELLAGTKRPDYITYSQFQRLWHFPGMLTEKLTKQAYTLIFKQFSRKANKSLMTPDNFNAALEYIGKELYSSWGSRIEIFKSIVQHLHECASIYPQ